MASGKYRWQRVRLVVGQAGKMPSRARKNKFARMTGDGTTVLSFIETSEKGTSQESCFPDESASTGTKRGRLTQL